MYNFNIKMQFQVLKEMFFLENCIVLAAFLLNARSNVIITNPDLTCNIISDCDLNR